MTISYIILFLFAALSFAELFAVNNKVIRNKSVGLCFLAPILMITMVVLCAIRGGTQGDYVTYKEVFELMTDPTDLSMPMNFFYEPLYSILQLVVKALFNSFQVFCLVIGLIVLVMQYCFAMEYTPNPLKSLQNENINGETVLTEKTYFRKCCCNNKICKKFYGEYFFTVMFVLWGLYRANIITTRSSIALCICLYSTKHIESENFKKFMICVLVACGFHYSAAIFIPSYFVFKYHGNLWKKLLILMVGCIFGVVGIVPLANAFARIVGGQLENKILNYTTINNEFMAGTGLDANSGAILLIKAIANIGILLVIGVYLWNTYKNNRRYEGYFNLYLIGCILYMATLNVNYAFARLSIYYNIFQVPMMLYLVSKEKYSFNSRLLHWFILAIYIIFRFLVNTAGNEIVYFWQ